MKNMSPRTRLWQIGLAAWLMTAMLVGSGSACACSHHEDVKAVETCASHHEMPVSDNAITDDVSDVFEGGCICAAPQRFPSIASRSETKKLAGDLDPVGTSHGIEFKLVIESSLKLGSPAFDLDRSYSADLRALLRPRSPPLL